MTAPTVPAARSPATSVVGPGAGQVWRRLRAPLAGVLVVVAAALVVGVAQSRTVRGELDPRAVDPAGSRALAVLLGDRGVDVVRVTSVRDAAREARRGGVLFVPFPERLPPAQLAELGRAAGADVRLVLVAPDDARLAAVTDDVHAGRRVEVAPRRPECGNAVARVAGEVDLGGRTYSTASGSGCYPSPSGHALVFSTRRSGGELVAVGSGGPFQNARLDRRGNAALALLLLGADAPGRRVVWLMSVPGSAVSDDSGAAALFPRWAGLAALQLLLGCVVLALWRARRLGPPVVEPLPVVVRAAETVEGRARLYRRAGARDRAAEALRSGALARLAPRLRLGAEPAQAAVVGAVARRTRRPEPEVHALLFGPPPADDAALVRLAHDLDAVVAATLTPPTPDTEVPHL